MQCREKAENACGYTVSFLCLALQVFPGPRTQDNEVRGFFMPAAERKKELKKNLKRTWRDVGKGGTFAGWKKSLLG